MHWHASGTPRLHIQRTEKLALHKLKHFGCCCSDTLMGRISDVSSAHVGAGVAHILSEAAASAVCLDIDTTSFLFVAANLSSGTHKAAQRNQEYAKIDQALVKLLCPATAARGNIHLTTREARLGVTTSTAKGWSVAALFDRVFWMGGLNYDIEATRAEVERCGVYPRALIVLSHRARRLGSLHQACRRIVRCHLRARGFCRVRPSRPNTVEKLSCRQLAHMRIVHSFSQSSKTGQQVLDAVETWRHAPESLSYCRHSTVTSMRLRAS
jgi:hypothetical protein